MKFNQNRFFLNYPVIMGVCNLTLDSFSDGGKNFRSKDALENIYKMYQNGAQIIDIGAESARPGSNPISAKKEISKLESILKQLPKDKFIISIDTNKIETQEFALTKGVHIINDIFGGSQDLFSLTKKYKNGLVLMHTPAPPKIMQDKIDDYKDIIKDIRKYFKNRIDLLNKYNISPSKVWLDPGIGFGKNLKQNLEILNKIDFFRLKNCGIAIGTSRKSWINKIDNSSVDDRIGGSLASVLYCLNKGVDIFRVHDVYETKQAITIYNKIKCLK